MEAENFRGFGKAEIPLRDQITVIIGENNAGKSTLLDALRLLTDPLDDRRSLYWDTDDVARIPSADNATLVANYELTTPSQHGLYGQAVVPGTDRVRYAVTFTPPPDARLRGRISWTAGNGATTDRDPEPAARDRLRHVYLPPLRDAHRELSTSSGARVRTILKYLLAETGDTEEGLVKHVQSAFGEVLGHRVFQTTSRAIRGPLADMTAGARRQTSDLAFADPDLLSISRALRIRMNEYGLSPREVAESGLGYANLLFIATVLVELRASRQQDLTLFLVEEPEAHLHPQLQALLLGYLRDAARLTNQAPGTDGFASRIQIVVATHSPQLASSTSVDDLVVLKRTRFHGAGGPTSAPSATAPARAESAPTRACAEPSRPAAAAHGVDERGPESGIRPVPLGQLGLPDGTTAKLQRYLDATRSAMFFAPRVLLVEGLAEALLLPVFAHRVLAPPEPEAVFPLLDEDDDARAEQIRTERAPWERFRGTTIVPLDSVDFEPYLRVLLTTHAGACVADRVAVITDEDPSVPGDRAVKLRDLAASLGSGHRFEAFTAEPTLEPELLRASPANRSAVKAAYLRQRPKATDRWERIEEKSTVREQAAEFARHFEEQGLRKGQFAQDLAVAVAENPSFVVPTYLQRAIEWISEMPPSADSSSRPSTTTNLSPS